jgi:hypothetical protein
MSGRRTGSTGSFITDEISVSNRITANIIVTSETFAVANTNPVDTFSVGSTFFVKNNLKRIVVKGTTKSDYYDVSNVSTDQSILVNNGGFLEGANAVTHNKTTGDFNVGGKLSFGKLNVLSSAQDGQMLYSNAGILEGAPVIYDRVGNETVISGRLTVNGALSVSGTVSQGGSTNFVTEPNFELTRGAQSNTISAYLINRPDSNIAISVQADNSLNMSYTTDSVDDPISIDTTQDLPVKIQGTLMVSGGTRLSQINFI